MFSNKKPNYSKLRTNLRLCINRLKLMEKKKTELALKARREIADYVRDGKDDRARIRVEHIIREDYLVEAMEMVEMFCDLLLARFGLLEKMKEMDPGLEETIATILWVTPRLFADIPELKEVSRQLGIKYSKEFVEACQSNKLNNVNEKVLHRMALISPAKRLVEQYMIEITNSYNVPFTPDPIVMDGGEPDLPTDLINLIGPGGGSGGRGDPPDNGGASGPGGGYPGPNQGGGGGGGGTVTMPPAAGFIPGIAGGCDEEYKYPGYLQNYGFPTTTPPPVQPPTYGFSATATTPPVQPPNAGIPPKAAPPAEPQPPAGPPQHQNGLPPYEAPPNYYSPTEMDHKLPDGSPPPGYTSHYPQSTPTAPPPLPESPPNAGAASSTPTNSLPPPKPPRLAASAGDSLPGLPPYNEASGTVDSCPDASEGSTSGIHLPPGSIPLPGLSPQNLPGYQPSGPQAGYHHQHSREEQASSVTPGAASASTPTPAPRKPVPAPRGGPAPKPTPRPRNNDPGRDDALFPELPDIPSNLSSTANDNDIDFDDLTKRFEELKRK